MAFIKHTKTKTKKVKISCKEASNKKQKTDNRQNCKILRMILLKLKYYPKTLKILN